MTCRLDARILITEPMGTNFCEILIKIYAFSFRKMHLMMLYGKWRPFCLGLNVLRHVLYLLCIYILSSNIKMKQLSKVHVNPWWLNILFLFSVAWHVWYMCSTDGDLLAYPVRRPFWASVLPSSKHMALYEALKIAFCIDMGYKMSPKIGAWFCFSTFP